MVGSETCLGCAHSGPSVIAGVKCLRRYPYVPFIESHWVCYDYHPKVKS